MADSTGNSVIPVEVQDAKARILAAATRLFGANGFEATSIQAIAEEVGVRKQSVLYHFPSKEHLRRAVIEASLTHWRNELPRLLAGIGGHDRFTAVITALLTFFREDTNRARLTLREMLDRPEFLQAQMREHLSPLVRLLADYIRMGQASGLLRAEVRPESYLVQVLMMVVSTVAIGDVASALTGEDRKTDASELVRIAREALFAKPRPDAHKD